MHFMVLAWDFPDDEGVARRDATRAAHTSSIHALWEEGHAVFGAGILDGAGVVRGSLVVVDYPSRADVDDYLANEPFTTENVWARVEVHALRVGDFYLSR